MKNSERSAYLKKAASQMAANELIKKKIEIPSEIKYIKRISQEILGHLKNLNVDDSIHFDVRLCVEEAVRNSIEHGHSLDKNLPIVLTYTVDKDKIKIEIEDQGKGFDVKKVPNPGEDENIFKGSGRGVFLIRKLMDNVVYNKKGNKVKMTKFLRT